MLNDNKNVKTIIFSELPSTEKRKYFNFLLENEVNFTRDENGYYVALVKLLNPAFYGNNKVNQSNLSETKSPFEKSATEGNPRSSSNFASRQSNKSSQNERSKSPVVNLRTIKEGFKTSLQTYNEMFNEKYQRFFKTLNPLIGVRGKKLNFFQFKYNIEEIYSIRFIKDTSTLKTQMNKKSGEADVKDPFPTFVVEFLTNKFVKKAIIDQHALDLLLSADHFKKDHKEIEIFAKFLNEEYDTDDLIFFLFVRSCIEKEMRIMFIEKSREEIKLQYQEYRDEYDTDLYLNIKVCLKIANTIFGNEEELLLNSFMEKVEKNLIANNQSGKKNKNLIKASTILEITLEDYHQSRKLYGQNTSNVNVEINKNETIEKFKDENMFDEFDDEINDMNKGNENSNKRVSINRLVKGDNNINSNVKNNQNKEKGLSQQEKVNRLKSIIFNYIKEKELDIFFEKLITSYSVSDRDHDSIENTLITIKELVGKKLALLISIIFNQDYHNWFISLKIKEEDSQNRQHYNNLVNLMGQTVNYSNIQDVPGNLIETFGQTLLSTPELYAQINKLVLKHFG